MKVTSKCLVCTALAVLLASQIGFVVFLSRSFGCAGPLDERDAFYLHKKTQSEKASKLLSDGLEHIAQYDEMPVPDGPFSEYVGMLCALPPRREHIPLIVKLIGKSDPHLQEKGVRLAWASAAALGTYHDFEEPLCRLLERPDLDRWVLLAVVDFGSCPAGISPDLTKFYGALAAVAYGPPPADPTERRIWRSMPIAPRAKARAILREILLHTSEPDPRCLAILPYFEKAYGTKGFEETRRAVYSKPTLGDLRLGE